MPPSNTKYTLEIFNVMSLQGFYMAVIECRALISIEEDRKTDGMVNRDFGGDCKIVVEEHALGESGIKMRQTPIKLQYSM